MLFDSRWEVHDVCIGKPGILELADIETELFNHCLEASNSKLHIHFLEVDLIDAVIADKKI